MAAVGTAKVEVVLDCSNLNPILLEIDEVIAHLRAAQPQAALANARAARGLLLSRMDVKPAAR